MTSIIVNTFYRALLKIEEESEEGFSKYNAKTLAVRLVDDLYPEDGYIALEDDVRGSLRVHLDDRFLDRLREHIAKGLDLKQATEAIGFKEEVVIPVAAPEVKEVKVKEVKPKLTKEQKEAEKAEKEAAKAVKAKADADAKAVKAKADADAKAAKAVKAKADADPVEALTEKLSEMVVARKKASAKPKFVGNLEKMNATLEKTWKKVATEKNVELTDELKTKFLTQINLLDNTVYNAKKFEVHVAEFFTPKVPELKVEPMEMFPVEFKGKEYWVNKAGVVYQTIKQEDGSEIEKKVGHVGQLSFSEMEMPDM